MSAKSIFGMAMNVSDVILELREAGMRVEVGGDFAKYRNYRLSCTDRGEMSPLFDTASSFVDETNGFWICAFNDADELVHTQAVRMLDMNGVSLGQHLDLHRHKYVVPDTTPDPDKTFFRGPEALKSVTGSVGYCGDFWIRSRGLGGPRSQGATGLLSRLIFELVQESWQPDYIFAFVPKQLASKGAHLRYGYSHCEPGRWIGPDQQVTDEEYLIWMSAQDIKNVIARDLLSLRGTSQLSTVRTTPAKVGSAV